MRLITLLLLVGLFGCDSSDPQSPMTNGPMDPPPSALPMQPADAPPVGAPGGGPAAVPIDVEASDGDRVELAPPYDAERRIMPRPRRRMNIDQLQAAVLGVSGGINWTERRGREDVVLFDALSATLGKPDFAETTDEELEATVLFQKFLGDAARSVCTKMMAADQAALSAIADGAEADWMPRLLVHVSHEETMETDADAIQANMQVLLQRFHGRRLEVDAPGLAHWHWLFQSASFVTDRPADAWLAVCVALFTHPDFYMY